jgi:hypothetical protein
MGQAIVDEVEVLAQLAQLLSVQTSTSPRSQPA